MQTSRTTLGHLGRIARSAAIGLIAMALVAGCSNEDSASGDITGITGVGDDSTAAESRTKESTADAQIDDGPRDVDTPGNSTGTTNPGNGNTGGGNTGGGNTGGGASTTTSPAAAAPVIVSFDTPENIDCHNGNFQMFTVSWNVTGATEVTISIDGPGIYDTYPPVHEVSLPFTCPESHTFLLTAKGADGQTTTQQITLDSRNAQTPSDPDDLDDQD